MKTGWTEQQIFTMLTLVVHTGCYVGVNGFFFLCARIGLLSKFQFDRKPFQVPTRDLLNKTFFEALVNQCLTGPVVVYFGYNLFTYFGMPSLTAPIPSFLQLCYGFTVAHLFNDVMFYWSHRAVHHPKLYGYIHKQHHTYTGSIGVAAEYASPVEQIVSNQIPSIGGCLFFGCHGSVLMFLIWLTYRLEQTYEAHSGFCFRDTLLYKLGLTNADAAAYHDYHHSGNCGNFGAEWLDWTFGTMDSYVQLGGAEGYIEQCEKIGKAASAKSKSK